jgi:short-subunit dehydrogenase
MIAQGFGHIVNTASMAGLIPNPLNAAYAATKHAVVGLSQSLRIEAAYLGVRVSVICPGVVRTPILRGGEYGAIKTKIPQEKLDEMWEELKPMDPVLFAKKVLNGLAKNKAMIIYPAWWKLLWFLNRFSLTLGMAFVNQRFGKMHKEYDLYKQ